MPDTTARLALPILAAAQAQKHVTHNEALQMLDGITQLVLNSVGAVTPPASPTLGEVHALGSNPTGDWAGQAGQLAQWQSLQWIFVAPQEGWRAWDSTAQNLLIYRQGAWVGAFENLSGLGIGTQSDANNQLAVSGVASLFSHAGQGHQIKLNKASAGDTASLLYQSNWAGHAEIGLTGDNNLHVKTSADGSTWVEALVIEAATGLASGAAVQSSPTDITSGRLARADYVYGAGNLLGSVSQIAGVPTGAVIEAGENALGRYVRFADGTQICTGETTLDITQTAGAMFRSDSVQIDFAVPFSVAPNCAGSLFSAQNGWLNASAADENSWAVCGFSYQSFTGQSASLVAIGRWY